MRSVTSLIGHFGGDTHLHTAASFDAGVFGARLLPPDAYKFAKGEEVIPD